MSAESDLQTLLEAHGALSALVGDRIAQNAVDQGESMPYVVWTSKHTPDFHLDNSTGADNVQFVIECWAETAAEADEVADAVVAALLADGTVCTSRATGYNADTQLDATVLIADWWV